MFFFLFFFRFWVARDFEVLRILKIQWIWEFHEFMSLRYFIVVSDIVNFKFWIERAVDHVLWKARFSIFFFQQFKNLEIVYETQNFN